MRRLILAVLLTASATTAVAQGYAAPGYGQGYAQGYDQGGPPPPPGAYGVRGNDPVERRWADAQARYSAETQRYRAEWDAYRRARGGRGPYGQARPLPYDDGAYGAQPGPGGYARAPIPGAYADDDRDENGYDASRDYRAGTGYRERVLASDDRVYAGSDGRYYCKRNDGTTGLIIGGATGGILGNVIDGGHSRAAGTLIGGALGALAGRAVDQNSQQVRCR